MPIEELFPQFIDKLGTVGFLVGFIIGLTKRWWVIGVEHVACLKEKEMWRKMALDSLSVTHKAVGLMGEKDEN